MIMENVYIRGRRQGIGENSYYFGKFSVSLKSVQIKFFKEDDNTLLLFSSHANVKELYKIKYKLLDRGIQMSCCFLKYFSNIYRGSIKTPNFLNYM